MITTLSADPFADVSRFTPPLVLPGLLEAARAAADGSDAYRRCSPRHPVASVATARPVDADGKPTGPAFGAVVADLSAGGLRLLYSRHVAAGYLAVRIPCGAGERTYVIRVARAVAAGRCYEYGGPFVARLGDPEA